MARKTATLPILQPTTRQTKRSFASNTFYMRLNYFTFDTYRIFVNLFYVTYFKNGRNPIIVSLMRLWRLQPIILTILLTEPASISIHLLNSNMLT